MYNTKDITIFCITSKSNIVPLTKLIIAFIGINMIKKNNDKGIITLYAQYFSLNNPMAKIINKIASTTASNPTNAKSNCKNILLAKL